MTFKASASRVRKYESCCRKDFCDFHRVRIDRHLRSNLGARNEVLMDKRVEYESALHRIACEIQKIHIAEKMRNFLIEHASHHSIEVNEWIGRFCHPSGDPNLARSVEFPVVIKRLFKPHYVTWSEQQRIERQSPQFLRNIVRILTETGLRINKELLSMKKDQVDIANATAWIPDSKTENGVAEVPLTPIAVDAFRNQLSLAGPGDWLFPSHRTAGQHYKSAKGIWRAALHKAGVSYFRIYDLRSTYATRLSAGGVADEWVVQLLRQGNSDVFKKYSQMKLKMKREALQQINRRANEMTMDEAPSAPVYGGFGTVLVQ